MGCGVLSKEEGANVPEHLAPDPADFTLAYIELQPSNLPEFDMTFSQIEDTLNSLIELNNGINDHILDVLASFATCADRLQVEVTVGNPA